jgi:branched-chain amino acid transport system substrate-binding protein
MQKKFFQPTLRASLAVAMTSLALMTACKKGPAPAPISNTAPTAPAASNVIRIGEVGSMTGNEATFGISTHNGIMLAVQQVNETGGIQGKKVEVLSLDDRGISEEAATAVTRLITQSNVIAILGEVASSRSIPMAPVAQQHKTVMITPSSTNEKVTTLGDYIFRVCFIDPFQGTVMAKFAKENLKLTKVAIMRAVDSDYSDGLSRAFVDTFKKIGGQIVVEQSYGSKDMDFKSQLTAIRAKNPEAIFVPGYYTDTALIHRQARELGIQVPLLGGDGWDSPKLKEIGGDSINGSYFSNHYSAEDKAPHVQEFIAKFKAAYGVVPDGLAAMGYDAMMVLAAGMKRAKTLAKSDIRDAVAATKDFQGVTGKITLNAQRNAVKSAVVLKIEGGNFKYQATVYP